jgi:hypothetical protein
MGAASHHAVGAAIVGSGVVRVRPAPLGMYGSVVVAGG